MSDLYKKISDQLKESEKNKEKEHQRKLKLGQQAYKDYKYKTQYLIDPRPSSLFRNLKFDLLKLLVLSIFAGFMFSKIAKETKENIEKDNLYKTNDNKNKDIDKYVRFDKYDFVNDDKFRKERALAKKHKNLEEHYKDL